MGKEATKLGKDETDFNYLRSDSSQCGGLGYSPETFGVANLAGYTEDEEKPEADKPNAKN